MDAFLKKRALKILANLCRFPAIMGQQSLCQQAVSVFVKFLPYIFGGLSFYQGVAQSKED